MQKKNKNNRNTSFYNEYKLSKYYDDYIHYKFGTYQFLNSQWELKLISSLVKKNNVNEILLVGMGFGREIDHILKQKDGILLDVLDFNDNFIQSAKKIYSSKINFINFDITKNSLNDLNKSYDLIVCLNTLEYVNDRDFNAFVKDARLIMHSNSIFLFRLVNKEFIFNFIESKHMKARKHNAPFLYSRKYKTVSKYLNNLYSSIDSIPLNMRLNLRLFNWLYLYFGEHLWYFELFLTYVIPKKYFSSIFYILRK